MREKTYIWSLPTRVFHWLMGLGFAVAYLTGDFEKSHNIHYTFGALAGSLVFFRILFGIFGPRYSNFKDFPLGLAELTNFIKNYFSKSTAYPGHNPIASVVMLLILATVFLTSISGFILYVTESKMYSLGFNKEFLEDFHESLANFSLFLVFIHLIGVIIYQIFHKESGTFQSIFTGYKNIEGEDVRLTGFHKSFILVWFLCSFLLSLLAYSLPPVEAEHAFEKNGEVEAIEEHEEGGQEDDDHGYENDHHKDDDEHEEHDND